MKKSDLAHLENITEEQLLEFQKDSFIAFASCFGRNIRLQIGYNGLGQFCVKENDKTAIFESAKSAVEHYKEKYIDKNN